jgi:ubiquinone/menaquinone biosynthesis C-methylase UbiE
VASPGVDLYNSAYGNYERDLYREVRLETYGEDFGQTSWVTTEESHEIPRLLGLTSASSALEIGCGSGGYALHLAETYGCDIVGLDLNAEGIRNANALAGQKKLGAFCRFQECDASQPLPFADESFDAVFSNDVLCHVPRRPGLLREIFRVLKPGGRLLFSDALIVGGMISHEEIAMRSAIGRYFFSPPGENEKLLELAGLQLICARDTTESAAGISRLWRDAREKRKAEFIKVEGEANFSGLQRFLDCVHKLSSERRLLRFLYVARK